MDIQVGEKEMWITQGHHQLFRQVLINSHKSPQSESVQMCAVAFFSLASLFYHSQSQLVTSHMTKGSSSLKQVGH